ncbi:NAD(P)/FAD-dependent oxidoreductase [Candidatus Rhabdochlamydia sp. T3358]|uniref:NAD(P)/FAD-dependent oxidoreductase n=1 Tax=Candidatus Rhabdochlamydia sp. T3358 TaxID=2099795 RepID=UPI0010B647B5|nr:NAD(P)/FAD-dependent oxidoreductase [Candidatus Rhabdochlamydia sp. T3358]VHO02056.1 NADH dehydrogenase-like protein [Candidatus Rhabdochlamydia sp. T3358]
MTKNRIIIIGGGFGGLNAAKALKKADVDILLIDKTNYHLFQPLLYEVATAALSPGEIATPLREILRNQENVSVIMGEVADINTTQKQVILSNQAWFGYDYLIIANGARHSYFGNDQWEAFAPGLKTIPDALNIREQILISFEKAERADFGSILPYLTFVIIGGGPTGVEMAGAIAEIAYKTMFKNFRKINPEIAQIFLIEACPNILPSYPERLSKRAKKDLEKLGVQVLNNTKVTNIDDSGVQIADTFIASKNIIWAAGNQASKLLARLNTPLDRAGRVIVEPDLTLPNFPEVFVIGDAAHVEYKNKLLPGIAPVAIQQGRYVAKTITRDLDKKNRKPFKYFDKGSMATIGKAKAIAFIGKLQFTGFIAWLMWAFIHLVYLIGFRDRFIVLIEWVMALISGKRGVRLIYSRSIDETKK